MILIIMIGSMMLLLSLLLPWSVNGLSSVVLVRREMLLTSWSSPTLLMILAGGDVSFLDEDDEEDQHARTASVATTTIDREDGDERTASRGSPRRPYAPIETLVPAIRVAMQIEQSLEIVKRGAGIILTDSDERQKQHALSKLRTIWIDQPIDYFAGGSAPQTIKKDKAGTSTIGIGGVNAPAKTFLDRYERNRNELSILQQPGALLVERGEISAWQNLRRREIRRSQSQPARAAFNYYTDALQYDSTSYILTAPKEERSRMIRNDKLPDINQVVTSDLDLRYLYRNQVLTNIDDAVAELRLADDDCNMYEVVELFETAQTSMRRWLDFIDPNDIQAARNMAFSSRRQ